MNKYKFADKVMHTEKGLGVVLGWYERMDSQIAYHVAWASLSGGVENRTFIESELMPFVESHWIKCSERMPELGVSVLALEGTTFCVNEAYDFGDRIRFYDDYEGKTTHWMPLPDLPSEDTQ